MEKDYDKTSIDDEFKQGVVDYANQHPEESKVSIAKSFGMQIVQFING